MLRVVVVLCLLALACACGGSEEPAADLADAGAGVGSGSDQDGAIAGSDSGSAGGSADASAGADSGSAGGSADASAGADSGSAGADSGSAGDAGAGAELGKFSFFVTSLASLRKLSNSQSGFGGDLRYGETGDGAGLRGADKICAQIAELGMPGSSAKQWRAFLSTSTVNAKDRVGSGPWYDRAGRLVAQNLAGLIKERPDADTLIVDDLPNEFGVPNHDPDGTGQVDNHDILTGTNTQGTLYCPSAAASCTCSDWTSAQPTGKPRVGHSWPRRMGGGGGGFGGTTGGSANNWMSALDEAGCAPGVNLIEMGPPQASNPTVGSGGGYGGFYCFALTP
jgi:hypothetical protein